MLIVLIVAWLLPCLLHTGFQAGATQADEQKDRNSHTSLDSAVLDISGDGGVLKEVLLEGSAETLPLASASQLARVTIFYFGRLESGEIFDNSSMRRDGNPPAVFVLGQGHLVRGWDMAVASMRIGEQARITIRADYAYGVAGLPSRIPPHATLTFEVEVVGFDLVSADVLAQQGTRQTLEDLAEDDRLEGEQSRTIMVGGVPVKMDKLGPVILNEDGSMRRIANWNEMTEREQQLALKRIGKRNQQRLAKLREEAGDL